MKFVLFICISLLANMFHAAAMPVSHVSHMSSEVATVEMQHMDMHLNHIDLAADELKTKNHCPENGSPCCLVLALQPFSPLSLTAFAGQERHIPLSPHFTKRTPVAPFRPPKFYLS